MEPQAQGMRTRAPGITIRPAEPGDIEPLWVLVRGLAAYEKMEDVLTGSADRLAAHVFGRAWPPIDCRVAAEGERLVGYAIFYGVYSTFWTRPMLWLEDLYVADSHRGRGVGRALLAAVARVAVDRDCVRLDWAVLEWNQPSIDFYERLGATRHGGWHGYRLSGERLEGLAREAQALP